MRTLTGTGAAAGRRAGSRLTTSLSRISAGAGTPDRAHPPTGDEPFPPGGVDAASPPVVSKSAARQGNSRNGEQAVDDWLVLWEERAEQIAYRLSLIDGQFDALIRKREIEAASTSPPPVRQAIESLSQLFPET